MGTDLIRADLKEEIKQSEENIKEETKDETKIEDVIKMAKLRIGISPITLDDLNRVAAKEKVRGEEALKLAVKEFLSLKLKMEEDEMAKLGEYKVHRKNDDENEKVYLNFNSEESCDYINR